MLKSKNQNDKISSVNNVPTINIVSSDTVVEGDYIANSDIRVSGKIIGNAISKGKIIITESGIVQGKSISENADITGRIEGEITVNNKLILRNGAVIDGDVIVQKLLVEEGAIITGNVKMKFEEKIQLDKLVPPNMDTAKNGNKIIDNKNTHLVK